MCRKQIAPCVFENKGDKVRETSITERNKEGIG
jgi:hypothetical protein